MSFSMDNIGLLLGQSVWAQIIFQTGLLIIVIAYLIKYRQQGIVELYKENIKALEDRVKHLEDASVRMMARVDKLSTENDVLKEVITGRDAESIEFREKGMQAMQEVAELKLVMTQHNDEAVKFRKQHSEEIRKLYQSIERHMKSIDRHGK